MLRQAYQNGVDGGGGGELIGKRRHVIEWLITLRKRERERESNLILLDALSKGREGVDAFLLKTKPLLTLAGFLRSPINCTILRGGGGG